MKWGILLNFFEIVSKTITKLDFQKLESRMLNIPDNFDDYYNLNIYTINKKINPSSKISNAKFEINKLS